MIGPRAPAHVSERRISGSGVPAWIVEGSTGDAELLNVLDVHVLPSPLRPAESETQASRSSLCGKVDGFECTGVPPLPASGSRFWNTRDQVLSEWGEGARNRPSPDPGLQSLRSAVQCGWR